MHIGIDPRIVARDNHEKWLEHEPDAVGCGVAW